jgi:hypothetical protein
MLPAPGPVLPAAQAFRMGMFRTGVLLKDPTGMEEWETLDSQYREPSSRTETGGG